jgi:hypothetical protein
MNCGCCLQEVTAKWRKLHDEELRNFHSSPSIVRISNQGWDSRTCSTRAIVSAHEVVSRKAGREARCRGTQV